MPLYPRRKAQDARDGWEAWGAFGWAITQLFHHYVEVHQRMMLDDFAVDKPLNAKPSPRYLVAGCGYAHEFPLVGRTI